MKIGTDLSVLAQPGRSDAAVLAEHLALGDLAEPLGFDSLFGLEHHFTGYSMSPHPLQLRTTRVPVIAVCHPRPGQSHETGLKGARPPRPR